MQNIWNQKVSQKKERFTISMLRMVRNEIFLKQSQLHSCKLIFPLKSLQYIYIPCFRLGGMTLTAGGFVYPSKIKPIVFERKYTWCRCTFYWNTTRFLRFLRCFWLPLSYDSQNSTIQNQFCMMLFHYPTEPKKTTKFFCFEADNFFSLHYLLSKGAWPWQ